MSACLGLDMASCVTQGVLGFLKIRASYPMVSNLNTGVGFICALWPPAGKVLTSWLSFVVYNCEFVTFPLVSWVRCGS